MKKKVFLMTLFRYLFLNQSKHIGRTRVKRLCDSLNKNQYFLDIAIGPMFQRYHGPKWLQRGIINILRTVNLQTTNILQTKMRTSALTGRLTEVT